MSDTNGPSWKQAQVLFTGQDRQQVNWLHKSVEDGGNVLVFSLCYHFVNSWIKSGGSK
jgi:hypothetical protein